MRNELSELAIFSIVAEEQSFTRAGARLGLSQSAVSHMMRTLEKKLGIQLLARTTRSVSPTAAGYALLRNLNPALERIEQSLAEARNLRDHPAGKIQLVLSPMAARMILLPKLTAFSQSFPEFELDITCSNDTIDLIAGHFDAGIHIGEFIQRDMIAVKVSRDMRLAVVGSPAYFESRKTPRSPDDLKHHSCIALRLRKSGIYRWEFEKGRRSLTVNPRGFLTFSDADVALRATLEGAGLLMTLEAQVEEHVLKGDLVSVLGDWCPTFPGYFLFYPSRRNQPAALMALINAFRL
jgi:DNA-binding transcriptional LysR family regulator